MITAFPKTLENTSPANSIKRVNKVDMWRNKLHLPCLQVNYGNF